MASATRKSAGFWLLATVNALLALAVCALIALLWLGREGEGLRALSTGHRLVIETKSGEVSGSMRSLKTPDAKPDAAADPLEGESKKKPAFEVGGADDAAPAAQPGTAAARPDDTAGLIGSEEMPVEAVRARAKLAGSLTAPLDSLSEPSPFGPLPIIGPEGSPRRVYARPFTPATPPKPLVAILLLDAGLQQAAMERALDLPPEISVALSPYAPELAKQAENLRHTGHESWLMLPAQPQAFPASDPGPKALLNDLKAEEKLARFKQVMAAGRGAVGLVLPVDEIFSDQPEQLEPLVREAQQRGVAMVAAVAPVNPGPADMLRSTPGAAIADLVLDAETGDAAFAAQLTALEALAVKQGHALAVVRLNAPAVKAVQSWLATLPSKNLQLAPASAILEARHP